ncbi:MAG TPA: TolC family protein [Blastocatellia bacterium]|nr:TolC family protein [Blastocatellia bacterium]
MQRVLRCLGIGLLLGCRAATASGQTPLAPLTWQQVKDKFEAANPTLQAGQIGISESRAQQITAFLRPNPNITGTIDQLDFFSNNPDHYRPFAFALPSASASYLHERAHKRELRLESAQQATAIAESQLSDQERTLLFNLRSAFVQILQQKAVLALAKADLDYFDQELTISRDRFKAGDISQLDLDRIELQRVQYESDYQTAEVNLRTAKISMLTLLDDRTPVEQFDVTGSFTFSDQIDSRQTFRDIAIQSRPDLKAALQAVDKAKVDYRLAVANGSTDPTFSVDFARNPPIPVYMGFSVTIPLRIFDRNQGEKERTRLDVGHAERLSEAALAQVFSDVDSAHAMLISNLNLLRPYRDKYLRQATRIRDTTSFAYQNGGAALVDFLDAQRSYRAVQLAYINLIGAYLTAASQLNLAVGREVIQ